MTHKISFNFNSYIRICTRFL